MTIPLPMRSGKTQRQVEALVDAIESGVHSHTIEYIDGTSVTTCYNGSCDVESINSGVRSGRSYGGPRSSDS